LNENVKLTRRKETDEAIIYCGPNIGRVLRQYAVFIGPPPEIALDIIKKHPSIRKMIVPVSQLPKFKAALLTPGTVENLWFNKIYNELAAEIDNGSIEEAKA